MKDQTPNLQRDQLIRMLTYDVGEWNAMRREFPDFKPQLVKADLSGSNLRKADLRNANLRGSELIDADLIKADLRGARLEDANLVDAGLIGADLSGADLSGAALIDANLCSANLEGANLTGAECSHADFSRAVLRNANMTRGNFISVSFSNADLSGANLDHAELSLANLSLADLSGSQWQSVMLYETTFSGTILRHVQGLDQTVFLGPCGIDLRTIQQSGKLPKAFLRQCGLSESYLEHIDAVLANPQPAYAFYVSYSQEDRQVAQKLLAELQRTGLRCWSAPNDAVAGEKIRRGFTQAAPHWDHFLVLISKHTMNDDWFVKEWLDALMIEAQRATKILTPILLDDGAQTHPAVWASIQNRSHYNLTDWREEAFWRAETTRLIGDLQA